jgi:hypothetical protein
MEIITNDDGTCKLIATKIYNDNAIIHVLKGEEYDKPSRTTIEVDTDKHIDDKYGIYINHSFTPSTRIEKGCVVANKYIQIREEITFNYNLSETEMATPFIDNNTNLQVSGNFKIK